MGQNPQSSLGEMGAEGAEEKFLSSVRVHVLGLGAPNLDIFGSNFPQKTAQTCQTLLNFVTFCMILQLSYEFLLKFGQKCTNLWIIGGKMG